MPQNKPISAEELIPQGVSISPMPDTYTAIRNLGKANIVYILRSWRKRERELRSQLKNLVSVDDQRAARKAVAELSKVREKIDELRTLYNAALRLPAYPILRTWDYFAIDSPVICYLPMPEVLIPKLIVSEKWAIGMIKTKPSSHGAYYYVYTEVAVHDGNLLNGHGLSFHAGDPQIMKAWEFDYLVGHDLFAKTWIQNIPDYLMVQPDFMDDLQRYPTVAGR